MASLFRSHKLFPAFLNVTKTSPATFYRNISTSASTRVLPKVNDQRQITDNRLINEIERVLPRNGALNFTKMMNIWNVFSTKEIPTSTDLLLLLKCCGSSVNRELPGVRLELAKKIWDFAKDKNIPIDVGHYNAFLKVCIDNGSPVSRENFIAEMTEKGITPSRVTYQYLLYACCQKGDLEEAAVILDILKKESESLNEGVFNYLIMGYCIAKDFEGAAGILKIMKEKGLEPDSTTYSMYLYGAAISGNKEKFEEVLKQAEENGFGIPQPRNIMLDIVYHLFRMGHDERAFDLIEKWRVRSFDNVAYLLGRLLPHKNLDLIFKMTDLLPHNEWGGKNTRFIIKHAALNEDVEVIKSVAEYVEKRGFDTDVMGTALYYTLQSNLKEKSYQIMDEMVKSGEEIKYIYFYPLIAHAASINDFQELFNIITKMEEYKVLVRKGECVAEIGKLIFENMSGSAKDMLALYYALTSRGLPRNHLKSALVISQLKRGNLDELSQFATNCHIEQLGRYSEWLVRILCDSPNPTTVVNLMKNSVLLRNHRVENLKTQSDEDENSGRDRLNKIAEEMTSKIVDHVNSEVNDSEPIMKLLGSLVVNGLRISNKVGERVIKKWNDPEITHLVNQAKNVELNESSPLLPFDVLHPSTFSDFRTQYENGNFDETKKMLNEHPDQRTMMHVSLIKHLKKRNEDEKIREYLKDYVINEFPVNVGERGTGFLYAEMIARGFHSEVLTLLENCGRITVPEKMSMVSPLKTIIREGSDENVEKAFNIALEKGLLLKIIDESACRERYLQYVKNMDLSDSANVRRLQNVILVCAKMNDFDIWEEIGSIIEGLPKSNERKFYYSLLYYASTGNIRRGQQVIGDLNRPTQIDLVKDFNTFTFLKDIKLRITLLQNSLKIFANTKWAPKQLLFEKLLYCYIEEKRPVEEAMELWTEMQVQDIKPTFTFLNMLRNYCAECNQEMPFTRSEAAKMYEIDFAPPSIQKVISEVRTPEDAQMLTKTLRMKIKEGKVTVEDLKTFSLAAKDTTKNAEFAYIFDAATIYEYLRTGADGELDKFLDLRYGDMKKGDKMSVSELPIHTILLQITGDEKFLLSKSVDKMALWAFIKYRNRRNILMELLDREVDELIQNKNLNIFYVKRIGSTRAKKIFLEPFMKKLVETNSPFVDNVVPLVSKYMPYSAFKDSERNKSRTEDSTTSENTNVTSEQSHAVKEEGMVGNPKSI